MNGFENGFMLTLARWPSSLKVSLVCPIASAFRVYMERYVRGSDSSIDNRIHASHMLLLNLTNTRIQPDHKSYTEPTGTSFNESSIDLISCDVFETPHEICNMPSANLPKLDEAVVAVITNPDSREPSRSHRSSQRERLQRARPHCSPSQRERRRRPR